MIAVSRLLISLVFVAFSFQLQGASFDCLKASTRIEKLICADSQLSNMDLLLARSYKQALSNTSHQTDLKKEQRNWLKVVRGACTDTECLQQAYLSRITELTGSVPTYITQEPEPEPEPDLEPEPVEIAQAYTPPQLVQTDVQVQIEKPISIQDADVINRQIGELSVQIEVLTKVLEEQNIKLLSLPEQDRPTASQAISVISQRLNMLRDEYHQKDQSFSNYMTSVKPNDRDVYITARKASQGYPKIPYYIPGTPETGEFWVEPTVTNVGEQLFNFRLVDPSAQNETTRTLIPMTLDEINNIQGALFKIYELSQKAHEHKIRDNYSKRIVCFPDDQCPVEGGKGATGQASTEILFKIYEDGSTAGRIQRNKGAFQEGFNVAVDSALFLQAYLTHVIQESNAEFNAGSRTKEDLDNLFK